MAPSIALPPRASTPRAARVATLSTVAAAPPVPWAVGFGLCWYGAALAATGVASIALTPSSASTVRFGMWSSRLMTRGSYPSGARTTRRPGR